MKYQKTPLWIIPIIPTFRNNIIHSIYCSTAADRKKLTNSSDLSHQHSSSKPVTEIQLRNVHLSYGKQKVLRGLTLSIFRGQVTAIIGTSGTGKSSTLRLITGLDQPDSGEISIRGWKRNINIKKFQRSPTKISMVFQNPALFDSLTVGENVGFSLLRAGKLPEERIFQLVKKFLRRVDLEDTISKYPNQLSGGMQKRVSLARAIIYDVDEPSSAPQIVLYDEPTAGLDPAASTRIENIITNLKDVCPTSIVVTHQFSTIRRTADRVILVHDGGVVWDGDVKELDTTSNPYVRQFMSGSLEGPLFTDDVIAFS